MAGEGLNFANQNPNNRGNRRGGRPKKEISLKELLGCKGMLLKNAAVKFEVSEPIVRREVERLTGYETWTEFQRSPLVSRMQDKDKVVIIAVNYGGIQKLFDLAEIEEKIEEQSRFQELQKLIERSFTLQARTYDIMWFVEGMDHVYITEYENVKACCSYAAKLQFNYLKLMVQNK